VLRRHLRVSRRRTRVALASLDARAHVFFDSARRRVARVASLRAMSLRLRFAGRGVGGADDARERASDDRVSFGVLRLCVGRGTFARWKSVLLHFNPESASVVARGRANAQKRAVEVRRASARRATSEPRRDERTRDGALTMRAKTLNRCTSFAGTVIAVFDVDDV
jgi:hypothetical protein